MPIPNASAYKIDVSRNIGFLGALNKPEFPAPRASRRIDSNAPETSRASRSQKPYVSPDGDILDFDYNRIRRFVERFAWPGTPSEHLEKLKEHMERRASAFSPDGDRADFGNGRANYTNKIIYGFGDVSKTSPVEPKGECSTCNSRKYVDKSSDSSVSYQTPTKLNPQTAALAVGAHEREHVFNEKAKAQREDREIVKQTVSIKYDTCPECKIMYPSGGTTRTQSIKSSGEDAYQTQAPTQEQP